MRFLLHPLPQFSTLSADCVNDCAAFQAPFAELAKSFGAEQVAFVNGADDHLSEPLCCSACGGGMALHASNGPPPASQHGHVHRGYCTAEAAPLQPHPPTPPHPPHPSPRLPAAPPVAPQMPWSFRPMPRCGWCSAARSGPLLTLWTSCRMPRCGTKPL